jgi:hypothetical protein
VRIVVAASLWILVAACSGSGESSIDAGPDACVDPETEAQACARVTAECGSKSITDSCGASRTLACGTCTAPEECLANECGVPRVTFVAASPTVLVNATTITLATPTGAQEGDLLLAFVQTYGDTDEAFTGTEGWTQIRYTDQGSQTQHNLLRKRVAANEPAEHTFTTTNSASSVGFVLAYRGADAVMPIDAEAVSDLPSGTSLESPSPTVTPTAATPQRVLLTFHSVFYAGTIASVPVFGIPAGMTERVQATAPAGSNPPYDAVAVFEEELTSADPVTRTSTIAITVTGSNLYSRKIVNAILLTP